MRILASILTVALTVPALAGEPAPDAKAVVADSGVGGGLCVAIGCDPAFAKALANESRLYVQLVAQDEKTALDWLRALDAGKERANTSAVCHKTNPLPYARDVANLIVVKGEANYPPAAELARVLAPGGAAVIYGAPAALAAEAEKFGLTKSGSSGALVLRKPQLPATEDWGNGSGSPQLGNSVPGSTIEPTTALRWRAGPRWDGRETPQDVFLCGSGVLVYRNVEFVPGKTDLFQRTLIGRDAYNGRELWRLIEQPMKRPHDGFHFYGISSIGEGRICMDFDGKLVCLDAATGKTLFPLELPAGFRLRNTLIYKKYILLSGDGQLLVHSLADGKKLWARNMAGTRGAAACQGDTILVIQAGKVFGLNPENGNEVWSYDTSKDGHAAAALSERPFCSSEAIHYLRNDRVKTFVFALDVKTGKPLWSAEADNPKTVFPGFGDMSEGLSLAAFNNEIWFHFNKRAPDRGYTVHMTCIDARTGEVKKKNFEMHNGSTHCWKFKGAGNYLLYSRNQFVDRRDMKETGNSVVRSMCNVGHIPAERQLFMLPHNCRCNTLIRGVIAMGAPDNSWKPEASPVVVSFPGSAAGGATDAPGDWPTYRHDPQRSNSTAAPAGTQLKVKWEAPVGSAGLSQAVSAYGLVFVSDAEGQRVVALDGDSGAVKWTFPVGSRIQHPPTLHNSLCLVAANNGWVYGLDARTGSLLWKMLASPAVRYIGGQERFESLWPAVGGVLVRNGVGYVNAGHSGATDGGIRITAFEPASGKVLWAETTQENCASDLLVAPPTGDAIYMNARAVSTTTHKVAGRPALAGGCLNINQDFGTHAQINDYIMSIDRSLMNWRRERLSDGRISGFYIAFSEKLSIGTEPVFGKPGAPLDCRLFAADAPKKNKWEVPAIGVAVDGIVVAPNAICVAGHTPLDDPGADSTIMLLSPEDGKQLESLKLKDRPAIDGLSAAQGRLFVVTTNGKVICLEGK